MRTALVLLLVAACGSAPRSTEAPTHRDNSAAGPPAVDRKLLADVAAGLEEVLAAMAQITAGPDCPTMGAELHDLFDHSRPLFELARKQSENPEAAAALTAELDARAARVRPLVEAISPGLERCHGELTVVDAIQQMPTF